MAMFPLIELQGSAFERGRIHGERARARVERSLANYRALFSHCGIGWSDAQVIGARFRDPIGELDVQLLEEIEGIAAGCGRAPNELLALNARTEILPPNFPERANPAWLKRMKGADFGECTAIAVLPSRSATGGALLAQNWDWLGSQREALVILRSSGEGGSFVTLTEAGMLAKIGMNGHGLGVCLNILRTPSDGLRRGVPVHALLRQLLGCASVAEAERLVMRLSYGASSNIVCVDAAGQAASFELSPAGVGVVRAEDGALCHTNHFLDLAAVGEVVAPPASFSSEPRLARARQLVGERPKHGVEELKQMLRDESDGLLSICRKPDPSMPEFARIESVASTVMELARGVMHVAPDVPSRAEFVPIALEAEAVVQ